MYVYDYFIYYLYNRFCNMYINCNYKKEENIICAQTAGAYNSVSRSSFLNVF